MRIVQESDTGSVNIYKSVPGGASHPDLDELDLAEQDLVLHKGDIFKTQNNKLFIWTGTEWSET